MSAKERFAQEVRKVAREEARSVATLTRFRVAKLKPFTLESFSSDLRLVDGEEDFDVGKTIRAGAKVGDVVVVGTDDQGDPMALTLILPSGSEDSSGGSNGTQWFTGEAAPSGGLGDNGDFYLRGSNGDVYKKVEGSWEVVTNIRGPQGEPGEDGADGAPGEKGEKGDTGATGAKGEKGDTGATGAKGEKGDTGATGEKGDTGATGAEGRWPALHYTWLTNTENTDPTAGKLKKNAGATILRISETDRDGNGIAALLATWDDSTSTFKGHIFIRQVGAPKRFAIYAITGTLEDPGAYDNLGVSLIVAGEALENEKEVVVEFIRTGDKGDTGEKGATGEKGGTGEKGATGEAGISPSDWKDAVRVATTANITIATALNNGDTIDGVTLATGDRVLVKNQTTKKENGIWVVGVSPARATDADAAGELSGGTTVYVEQGTANAKRFFRIITNGSITPGTTEHEWAPLSEGAIAEPETDGTVRTKILTVTHNLGVVPTDIQLTRLASEATEVVIQPVVIDGSVTSSQFKIRGIAPSTLAGGQKIKIYWQASAF